MISEAAADGGAISEGVVVGVKAGVVSVQQAVQAKGMRWEELLDNLGCSVGHYVQAHGAGESQSLPVQSRVLYVGAVKALGHAAQTSIVGVMM